LIGRVPNGVLWLFGIYNRECKHGYVFLINNRKSTTLMPLINKFISNNSEVYSDSFKTYVNNNESRIENLLPNKHFTHLWVNHSISWTNMIMPDIHTNNIERFWNSLRKRVKEKHENP